MNNDRFPYSIPYQVENPILLICFNRPGMTADVLRAVSEACPKMLYVFCDGPREDNLEDARNVFAVRDLISSIDWDCKVTTLFMESNLGCGEGVSRAITWFFENNESGIILEDDCVPNSDFFRFCDVMLQKYKDDDGVFAITGQNFQDTKIGTASYYFSRYCHVWGWASWRRAWRHYDYDCSDWLEWRHTPRWKELWPKRYMRQYWERIFDLNYNKHFDTWDYAWFWVCLKNRAVTVTPNVNLVSNIGFGPNATHTKHFDPRFGNRSTSRIERFVHADRIEVSDFADFHTFERCFQSRWDRYPLKVLSLPHRLIRRIQRRLRK